MLLKSSYKDEGPGEGGVSTVEDVMNSTKQESDSREVIVSKSIHIEDDCPICKRAMWDEDGLEFQRCSVVQLQCSHCFHSRCYTGLAPSDGKYAPCPVCQYHPVRVNLSPLHKWQTIRFWVHLIDEALDQIGSRTYGVPWSFVRKRAREISGLTLKKLRAGDKQSNGEEDALEDEDLDGPGQFPMFAALIDSDAIRFTVNCTHHRGKGKWISFKTAEGTERMVFKYEWGVPPLTSCLECKQPVSSESYMTCRKCTHLCPKALYWCSKQCYEDGRKKHEPQCESLITLWE
eukprot:CAMPEP_0185032882 /NCGR_PEP_ID=MMETSP1103-20130426/21382_1 /TAXON_ID=36769 /ORGANISM="Paraphysomonas bandaiensis, Strain Caron Lab Isolate" /LENGTH=288 /DNA_ID=CAMNT_0027568949 /DNA_START=98 /DNA_END=961 /DNA_ORIENTATION=-